MCNFTINLHPYNVSHLLKRDVYGGVYMQTDLSTKSTESQIQKVILMIADISGYTRFMFSNQMDLAHSQWVISQFIQAILQHV